MTLILQVDKQRFMDEYKNHGDLVKKPVNFTTKDNEIIYFLEETHGNIIYCYVASELPSGAFKETIHNRAKPFLKIYSDKETDTAINDSLNNVITALKFNQVSNK